MSTGKLKYLCAVIFWSPKGSHSGNDFGYSDHNDYNDNRYRHYERWYMRQRHIYNARRRIYKHRFLHIYNQAIACCYQQPFNVDIMPAYLTIEEWMYVLVCARQVFNNLSSHYQLPSTPCNADASKSISCYME